MNFLGQKVHEKLRYAQSRKTSERGKKQSAVDMYSMRHRSVKHRGRTKSSQNFWKMRCSKIARSESNI